MCKFKSRFLIALITFGIGVLGVYFMIVKSNASEMPIKQVEQTAPKINRTTKDNFQQKQTVYDVEYSELSANPEKYIGKVVRVKALIFGGPLADPGLVKKQVKSIWIGYDFAPNAKEASEHLEEAFGPEPEVYIPHKAGRCERAVATVTGKFIEDANRTKENTKGGNKLSYQYWIIVNRLENIEPCPRLWVH